MLAELSVSSKSWRAGSLGFLSRMRPLLLALSITELGAANSRQRAHSLPRRRSFSAAAPPPLKLPKTQFSAVPSASSTTHTQLPLQRSSHPSPRETMFALCSAATPAAARPALARPAATRARVNCRAGPRRSADMVCSTKQEPLCPAMKVTLTRRSAVQSRIPHSTRMRAVSLDPSCALAGYV